MADTTSSEAQSTPLTQTHRELGARLVPFAGYLMPIQYQGIKKEHTAVREKAGLFDVSHMGEIRVRGAGARQFVNYAVTNDLDRIEIGQAMYTCACKEDGGILDDLIVYKHTDDDLLIVCNASNRDKIWQHVNALAKAADTPGAGEIVLDDESDRTALLALQGPAAFSILEAADPGLATVQNDLESFRFRQTQVAGVSAVVARTGYTGEDGVELFCSANDAVTVWNALSAAGREKGLQPAGLGARDTLRLEARLSLYGNELDESINPLEAGLGWTVKLSKEAFLGKQALERVKAEGKKRTIVGFEVTGRGIARSGYLIKSADGTNLGHCTSGAPSPTLGKPIGLGFVPIESSEIGTELLIDCRGKDVPARVVKTPFYRRQK